MTGALFSQRYFRALEAKTLVVEIPEPARPKIWSQLNAFDRQFLIKRDKYDNITENTSVLDETKYELLVEHGWDKLPTLPGIYGGKTYADLQAFVQFGDAAGVFDLTEIAYRWMDADERDRFRVKLNQIFELHGCPWRISDGEFFKLDGDFLGARLASQAHDILAANQFVGAANEFAKARQHLTAGDTRDAISYAGHSFESVMKVLTGNGSANADKLIKDLISKGFFDDLPESVRLGFADQVLKSLPFLRNKLAAHGHGAEIISIPPAYGNLAVQLASAFHNFLIAKHLERTPPQPENSKALGLSSDDDIPF